MGAKRWSRVPTDPVYVALWEAKIGEFGPFEDVKSGPLGVQNGYAVRRAFPLRGAFRRVPYWFAELLTERHFRIAGGRLIGLGSYRISLPIDLKPETFPGPKAFKVACVQHRSSFPVLAPLRP